MTQLGFTFYDAAHIASAERSQSDAFLTTDDRLLRRARKFPDHLNVKIENPLQGLLKQCNRRKQRMKTQNEVLDRGDKALVDALGVIDAIRFIQHFSPGYGDDTKERHEWLDKLSMNDF